MTLHQGQTLPSSGRAAAAAAHMDHAWPTQWRCSLTTLKVTVQPEDQAEQIRDCRAAAHEDGNPLAEAQELRAKAWPLSPDT